MKSRYIKLKILIIIIIALFSRLYGNAQDTTRVLFVGNSFTYYNDLHLVFKSLADSASHPVQVGLHAPGGVSVGDIAQGNMAHMNNPNLYQMMKAGNWDYMVLQDNQGRFVFDYGVFPSSSLVIEGHIMLRDSFQFYNPCGKVIWFAGWGPKDGYPPYASTGSGLIDKIYNNYLYLLDTAGEVIAPIGPAWKRVIAGHPSITLWDGDNVHPGPSGTFLTAAVVYSSIFKDNPLNSKYIHQIGAPVNDSLIKNIAYQTVVDSFGFTGLINFTPTLQLNSSQIWLTNSQNANWYVGDSLVATGVSIISPVKSGVYQAYCSDASGCGSWTLPIFFDINSSVNSFETIKKLEIFPNPFRSEIEIYVEEEYILCISDLRGNIIQKSMVSTGKNILQLEHLSAGYYIFTLKNENMILNQKALKF